MLLAFERSEVYKFLLSSLLPNIGLTLSGTTGMTTSQVTDEVLYTGLIEMQELDVQG